MRTAQLRLRQHERRLAQTLDRDAVSRIALALEGAPQALSISRHGDELALEKSAVHDLFRRSLTGLRQQPPDDASANPRCGKRFECLAADEYGAGGPGTTELRIFLVVETCPKERLGPPHDPSVDRPHEKGCHPLAHLCVEANRGRIRLARTLLRRVRRGIGVQ